MDLRAITVAWKPDLIINLLSWYHQSIPGEVLADVVRKYGRVASVFFDHDEGNLAMVNAEQGIFEASDVNVIADSRLRVDSIREGEGVYAGWHRRETARFSPLPVDLELFKATDKPDGIGLLGSLEGRRVHLLSDLQVRGVQVATGGSLLDSGSFLDWPTYAHKVSSQLANIVSQTQPYRTQLKGRSFQAAAAGTCLLEERTKESEAFFSSSGAWLWGTTEELVEAIDQVRSQRIESLERAHVTREILLPLLKAEGFVSICLGE